jgi:UDP:flavonoid glycosyltransferase YjiC (YdhE family)
MKFVVAAYGSRGDVEPCAAIALELLRRGHDVRMTVPPELLGFAESAGLAGAAFTYGPDPAALVDDVVRMIQNPMGALHDVAERVNQIKAEKDKTLTALAEGADLLLAGITEQELSAKVAEYHGIPVAGLHFFPAQILEHGRPHRSKTKDAEDAQRRALGSPDATRASLGSLEIQAYDELCLPEVAARWPAEEGRRPFVGALTLELPTDADDEVLSWSAKGTPPIYFGFGSMPLSSPADTVAVISAVCTQLGERALICMGPNAFTDVEHFDHVKVVDAVNHATVFPSCRAVVHHGGAGTTAAGLRAGTPTLILCNGLDQPLWAAAVQQLKVGSGRRFSETTTELLVADLRVILTPQYTTRARQIATQMTKPAESLANTADLLEDAARQGSQG